MILAHRLKRKEAAWQGAKEKAALQILLSAGFKERDMLTTRHIKAFKAV